jgi:hypothetical protein
MAVLMAVEGRLLLGNSQHSLSHLKAQPGFAPSALKISAAGQNPVTDAWIMFAPANTVSQIQAG